jgi:hypothetical protein
MAKAGKPSQRFSPSRTQELLRVNSAERNELGEQDHCRRPAATGSFHAPYGRVRSGVGDLGAPHRGLGAAILASFWWLYARRGSLEVGQPGAYAFASKVRLRLPLAFYNTGARSLIVTDLHRPCR